MSSKKNNNQLLGHRGFGLSACMCALGLCTDKNRLMRILRILFKILFHFFSVICFFFYFKSQTYKELISRRKVNVPNNRTALPDHKLQILNGTQLSANSNIIRSNPYETVIFFYIISTYHIHLEPSRKIIYRIMDG